MTEDHRPNLVCALCDWREPGPWTVGEVMRRLDEHAATHGPPEPGSPVAWRAYLAGEGGTDAELAEAKQQRLLTSAERQAVAEYLEAKCGPRG